MNEKDILEFFIYIFGMVLGIIYIISNYKFYNGGFSNYYEILNIKSYQNFQFKTDKNIAIFVLFLIFFISLFFVPQSIMGNGFVVKYKIDKVLFSNSFSSLNDDSDYFYDFKINNDFIVFKHKTSDFFIPKIESLNSNNFNCDKFSLIRHELYAGDVFYIDCEKIDNLIDSEDNFTITLSKVTSVINGETYGEKINVKLSFQ